MIAAFSLLGLIRRHWHIAAIICGIGLACAGWAAWNRQQIRIMDQATEKGAVTERAASQTEVLNNVDIAQNAISRNNPVRDQRLCRKNSRTPENCQ